MDPLWIFFVVVIGATLLNVICNIADGVIKLPKRKRKPRAEVDPWATWKARKAELDTGRIKEHADWQEDFDRLVQSTCVHSYPATGSKPTFYTCLKCKYEDPWDEPHEGCICFYETVTTLSSPYPTYNVTHRHGNCKWHGIDWPINQHTDRTNRPFKSWRA